MRDSGEGEAGRLRREDQVERESAAGEALELREPRWSLGIPYDADAALISVGCIVCVRKLLAARVGAGESSARRDDEHC